MSFPSFCPIKIGFLLGMTGNQKNLICIFLNLSNLEYTSNTNLISLFVALKKEAEGYLATADGIILLCNLQLVRISIRDFVCTLLLSSARMGGITYRAKP